MTWYVSSTKLIAGATGNAVDERARPQLHVDRVAAGRRVDGGLVEIPLRVRELARGSRRPAPSRWRSVPCADATDACSPFTCPDIFCVTCASLARRGGELRLELDHVGLRLLERELVARAGGHQFAVLPDPHARELELRLQRADLSAGRLELLAQFARARRRVRQRGAELARAWPRPRRACALAMLSSFWYGVGSMRNSSSPFFTSRLGSTGTSMHASPHLRHDLHDVLDDAHVGRSTARRR